MTAPGAERDKTFGRELLEIILKDGTPSTSAQAGVMAAGYHASRVEGKRLPLGNPDRPRPASAIGSAAHGQIQRRNKRLLSRDLGGQRVRGGATGHVEKGTREEKRPPPFSRRERQRLGLEDVDTSLTYESMLPIHQLWLGYIHRLLGFIDEKGAPQSSQFQIVGGKQSGEGGDDVVLSNNATNAFQASLVKADLCGAPLRGA